MNPVNELNSIILNNKIPNALLFTGNCSQEKKKAAFTFIKTINCLNRGAASGYPQKNNESETLNIDTVLEECLPCNKCRSCTKIDAGMHPDIITVTPEPEKSVIKIVQIRALSAATASKPHEAKMRMVIIEEAHTMNQEAANSLLKILEEPPERTFFLLLARGLNDLLPTVISRCQHLRFRPPSIKDLMQLLIHQCNVTPSVATIAARSSNGNIEKAMMFANVKKADMSSETTAETISKQSGEVDWIKRRRWLINQLVILIKPNQKSGSQFLYALILAEKLSKETPLIEDSLTLVKLWLRDMALVRYRRNQNQESTDNAEDGFNSDHIVNPDFVNTMSDISESLPERYPLMALEALHGVETKLQTNASVRLILEQFFLTLIPRPN